MQYSAQYFIDKLNLVEHPEGGVTPTFQAEDRITVRDVERPMYTSIYFLLRSQDSSHLHRLKSDELRYYHGGSSLSVHMIYPDGANIRSMRR